MIERLSSPVEAIAYPFKLIGYLAEVAIKPEPSVETRAAQIKL